MLNLRSKILPLVVGLLMLVASSTVWVITANEFTNISAEETEVMGSKNLRIN